jgi:hypothetical protein
MVHKPVLFVLLLAITGTGLMRVAAADAAPPEVIKILTRDEVVDAAGDQTTTLHVEKLATNESAAHNIAQYTLEFSESMETAEILEAFTRKADGKILEVDRTRIFPQAPPGSPQVPKFTDRKQKVVVFPNVTPEDAVITRSNRPTSRPFKGSSFSAASFFFGSPLRMCSEYPLPKAMAARIEGRVSAPARAGGGLRTNSLPEPAAAGVSRGARLGYRAALCHLDLSHYRRLRPLSPDGRRKVAVTPRIQALADEITAGTSDRRGAHRIYDWVSNISVIAVFLGSGASRTKPSRSSKTAMATAGPATSCSGAA